GLLAAAGQWLRHAAVGANDSWEATVKFRWRFVIAVFGDRLLEKLDELVFEVRQIDAILRALRPGHAWLHFSQIEFEHLAVFALSFARNAEHALGLEITADGFNLFITTTC